MQAPDVTLDLLRFLAQFAAQAARARLEAVALPPKQAREHIIFNFPVVQGPLESIKTIGDQPYNPENIGPAIEWLLKRD